MLVINNRSQTTDNRPQGGDGNYLNVGVF